MVPLGEELEWLSPPLILREATVILMAAVSV
jgi:hypothetical protein